MNWTSRLLKLQGRKQGKGRDGFWKIVCTGSHSFRGGFSGGRGQGRYSRVESSRGCPSNWRVQTGRHCIQSITFPSISCSESALILVLHDHQSIDSIRFYLFLPFRFLRGNSAHFPQPQTLNFNGRTVQDLIGFVLSSSSPHRHLIWPPSLADSISSTL